MELFYKNANKSGLNSILSFSVIQTACIGYIKSQYDKEDIVKSNEEHPRISN